MKLCSQCQFTFEDPQQFCDFDGTGLTVLPEHLPSFKNPSLCATASPSLIIRVARSRVSLAGLSLAGVMLSALLVGYLDSANTHESASEIDSVAEDTVSGASLVPAAQVAQPGQAQSSLPPSMVTRPAAVPLERTRVTPSNSKVNTKSLAQTQKTGSQKTNRDLQVRRKSQARNEPRQVSPDRDTQRRSATAMSNHRPDRQAGSLPRQKESKVVAIWKKTGSILTKPFKF